MHTCCEAHNVYRVSADDSESLTTLQAWLALGNLLLEPATCGRYDLDAPRTASLLRLRRLLHEVRICGRP